MSSKRLRPLTLLDLDRRMGGDQRVEIQISAAGEGLDAVFESSFR